MNVNDIISSGLLELYVTGAATKEEAVQVQQWAKQYPEVQQELDELQEALENYALSEVVEPSAAIKGKIFSRIQAEPKQQKVVPGNFKRKETVVYSLPSYFKWAAAACIILLLGSLVLNYTFYNKYRDANSELEKQQQIAQTMHTEMDMMADKNAMPVVLKGTPHTPDAQARIYWMQNTGDVYVDPTNLPQTPSGMQYQLWAIVDGKPVDAGMITTSKGTYHIQKMKSFGKAQAFAITLEKAGGSPTPTMDQMYVMAKI